VSFIEVAVSELQNSSQKIVNLAEEISSINQTSIQVLELHQNSQQSLGEIIPQLKQGAQSFQLAVTTLNNLQRQVADKPDTLSDVQVELTKLVDTFKKHL
jgi:seryl-tRNA synthetase